MIKYSWAYFQNNLVHISDVTSEMRSKDQFFNPDTGKRMTAYLSGKMKKHFHHVDLVPHQYETYLHKTAKEVFRSTYESCLVNRKPFILEYVVDGKCRFHFKRTKVLCSLGDQTEEFDLTSKFKKIVVEKNIDSLRPDIQLLHETGGEIKDVIFVEIAVTHTSSEEKIASENRIIEISIQNEEDILLLKHRRFRVKDNRIKFYNFNQNVKEYHYCKDSDKGCRTLVDAFLLYKNGSYKFLNEALEYVISEVESNSNMISHVDYDAFSRFYERMPEQEKKDNVIQSMMSNNMRLKDCRFCRYVGDNNRKGGSDLYCKYLRKDVTFDSAFECNAFGKKVNSMLL